MNRQHIFGDAFCWVRFNFLQEEGAWDNQTNQFSSRRKFIINKVCIVLYQQSTKSNTRFLTWLHEKEFLGIFLPATKSQKVSRLPGCETCVVKDCRRGTESQVESRAGAVDLSKIFGIRPVSENLFTLVK